MAFDWTKLDGYREDMTLEEKVALLDNFNFESEPGKDYGRLKARFDQTSSELAAVKKQLKEKMTEDERKEAERIATEEATKKELDELRRERAVYQFQQRFAEEKYDAKSAAAMAEALAAGNTDDMFKALRAANDAMTKAIKAELLANTPKPASGGDPEVKDSDSVALAKQIGGQRAAADKLANDIVNHYK